MAWRSRLKDILRIRNNFIRIFLAEVLGTFLLMVFGIGSVAQWKVGGGAVGEFWSVTVGYGFAVVMGVAASIGVSGGHINPAVTLAFTVLGRVKWAAVPFYLMGQYLGAFLASVVAFGVYYDALTHYDPNRTITGPTATAGIFSTYPQPEVSTLNTFIDQIVGTALLLVVVMALIDPRNSSLNTSQVSLYVGLLVVLISNSYGYNCGNPINPARDLSPRIFTSIAGWGTDVFSYRNYWGLWVPIIGPHIGAILGAVLYQILVGAHWPEEQEPETHDDKRKRIVENN